VSGPTPDPVERRGGLRDLRIQRLGVIEDAFVELADGLNVLTGETGAGKTMVVSGLGLLLGARGDSSLVRTGARAVVVEGCVDVPQGHPALARVADAGGESEDGSVVLVRTVGADGRSKAYVGGRQAPIAVLAALGHRLVAVHGQADQWRLRRPDQHRSLLDGYGGPALGAALDAYRRRYDEVSRLRAELAELEELNRDRLVQATVLQTQLAAIEELNPTPGEDRRLAAEEERLAHADALRAAALRAHALLAGGTSADGVGGFEGFGGFGGVNGSGQDGPGAADLLAQARAALAQAAAHDEHLAALADRVAELTYLSADVGAELAGYIDGLEGDPNRLAWVQQRRADLTRLTRGYGGTVDEALAWAEQAALRVAQLDSLTDRLTQTRESLDTVTGELQRAAAALTEHRRREALVLETAISVELEQLAMPHAVVEVDVSAAGALGPHGGDEVEIRLAANPGTPPRTVAKAASGGELSRVMLAIEVVTHQRRTTHGARTADPGPAGDEQAGDEQAGDEEGGLTTLVFDEVDAGVGGAAALAIGARLAALAQHTQVIVVTHLAQVAAYADRHITIHKSSRDGAEVTTSDVVVLDDDGRLRELARMMAGSADSDVAIEHARELLASAFADTRGGHRGPVGMT
jgi:DNA repair protein RecN (Recombination protein N)